MSTSLLLRQAVHELEAALDAAAEEYGPESVEVQRISDAVIVMRDFVRDYMRARQSSNHDDDDTTQEPA